MSDDLPILSEDDYDRIEEEMLSLPHGRAFLREHDRRCRVIGLESFEAHIQDLKSAFEDKRPTRRQIKGLADLQSYMIAAREQIATMPASQDTPPRDAFVNIARDVHNLLSNFSDTLSPTAGSLEHLRHESEDGTKEEALSALEIHLLQLSNLCSELDRSALKVLKVVVTLTEVERRLYSLGNDRSMPEPLTASEVQDMMEDEAYRMKAMPISKTEMPTPQDSIAAVMTQEINSPSPSDSKNTLNPEANAPAAALQSSKDLSIDVLNELGFKNDEEHLDLPQEGLELAVEAEQEVARLLGNNLDMLIMQQEGFNETQEFDLPDDPAELSKSNAESDLETTDMLLPASIYSLPDTSSKVETSTANERDATLSVDDLNAADFNTESEQTFESKNSEPETPEPETPEPEKFESKSSEQQTEDNFDLDTFLAEPSPTKSLS